ncbi:MAG: hypothetical protein ACRBCT_04875 [Alphaproteobacteria bacterium]
MNLASRPRRRQPFAAPTGGALAPRGDSERSERKSDKEIFAVARKMSRRVVKLRKVKSDNATAKRSQPKKRLEKRGEPAIPTSKFRVWGYKNMKNMYNSCPYMLVLVKTRTPVNKKDIKNIE